MIFMQLSKVFLSLLFIFIAASSAAQPLQATFSDWELSCDNAGDCQGRNIDRGAGLVVSFFRPSGQGSIRWLHIDYHPKTPEREKEQQVLAQRLLIDHTAWPYTHVRSAPETLQTEHPETAQQLLTVLSRAVRLSVTDNPSRGLSLTSLPDFLSKAAQIQARISRETTPRLPTPQTLVVTPPYRVPAPLSDSEISYFMNFGISQISQQTCPLAPVYRQIKVAPLTDHQVLLLVSCETAAYNTFYQAYLVSRQAPVFARRLMFRLPFSPLWPTGADFELTNVGYDPQTGILTTALWGRPLADYGTVSRWQFNGQRFVLTRFASESVCDRWNFSRSWPVLWTTDPAG